MHTTEVSTNCVGHIKITNKVNVCQPARLDLQRQAPNMKYGPEELRERNSGVVKATARLHSQFELCAREEAVARTRIG